MLMPLTASKPAPVVLMVTGSGLQNRDEEIMDHRPFAVIADHLARNGIASLRYDDRSAGSSAVTPHRPPPSHSGAMPPQDSPICARSANSA